MEMGLGTSRPNAAQETVSRHQLEDAYGSRSGTGVAVQISSSLVQLCAPSPGVSARIDIFFFHGLQLSSYSDAHLTTWRSRNESQDQEVLWPQAWLPTEFPEARIITVKYDASVKSTNTEGRMDMDLIGESLMHEILSFRKDAGRNCPVVLVGHSFGGLVIKQLCCFADRNKETRTNGDSIITFLDSVKGIFFYGTPHSGMEDFWSGCREVATGVDANTDLLSIVSLLSKEAGRLHHEFSKVLEKYIWNIYGIGETNPTPGRQSPLVPEASSRFGDNYYRTVGCDHFSVCRPTSKCDFTYLLLVNLIKKVRDQRMGRAEFCKTMVGMDPLLTSIHGYLRECRFLGLYGVRGVGKTTIAKQVFGELLDKFEYACFMEDFQRISGDKDELKKRMWEQMYHYGRLISEGRGYGTRGMWKGVSGKTLLVILDGINSEKHVEFLENIADENAMESSRFIVTCRDKHLLSLLSTIEIPELDDKAAREFFMKHAFPHHEEPPIILKRYLQEIVETCRGLPLVLKFCGRYLQTRTDEKIWAETLAVLKDHNNSLHRLEYQQLSKLMGEVEERLQTAHYEHLAEMAIQNVTPIVTVGGCGGADFYWYGTEEKILQKIEVWAIPFHIKAIRVWFTDETPKTFGDPSDRADVEYEEFTFNPTERVTSMSLWENKRGNRSGWIYFETNHHRKFDFGMTRKSEREHRYNVDVGSGICMGVVGRSGLDIDRLAFIFMKPSNLLLKMAFHTFAPISIVGGSGGSNFSCYGENGQILLKKLKVWTAGLCISAIKVWLTNHIVKTFGEPSEHPDFRTEEFTFESNELITHLSLWDQCEGTRLGRIEFKTNRDKEFNFGAYNSDIVWKQKYEVDVGSGSCVGILGGSGSEIDRLGFVFLKKMVNSDLEMAFQVPVLVVGGPQNEGTEFFYCESTDKKKLQKIKVWATQHWIKAIKVWFTNKKPRSFGDLSKGVGDVRCEEFEFQPNELITHLCLWDNSVGDSGAHMAWIQFETSEGGKFDFGAYSTKQKRQVDVGSGTCVGVLGAAGQDINRLGFVFLKRQIPRW